ncbi:MAG: lysophospholipid acyltransferase family protein [Mariprofundus sp.]|nr:lysophospholipid acyltransferase family protein [Mariprofundus sp.]
MLTFVIRSLFFLIRLIPVRLAGALGAGCGRIFYYTGKRHRTIALKNLRRVYPGKDLAWRTRVARESCAELGRTSFELPHVFLRSRSFLRSRITVEGEAAFQAAMSQGKGVILTACHHSNWELGGLSISMLGYASSVIYRPIRQAGAETVLKGYRERFGASFQSRHSGLRWLPRALKQGHCIAVMIDQHLSNGTPVPFLGHAANTTTLPAVFSNKYNTPIFGVMLHRLGHQFRFKLEFWPITIPASDQLNEVSAMQTICDSFAPAIHAYPELWMWIHRRWLYLDEQEVETS